MTPQESDEYIMKHYYPANSWEVLLFEFKSASELFKVAAKGKNFFKDLCYYEIYDPPCPEVCEIIKEVIAKWFELAMEMNEWWSKSSKDRKARNYLKQFRRITQDIGELRLALKLDRTMRCFPGLLLEVVEDLTFGYNKLWRRRCKVCDGDCFFQRN